VRYRNREAVDATLRMASLSGAYYCQVLINAGTLVEGPVEVPITIRVSVLGTAGEGAPTFVEGPVNASASPSATPPGSSPSASAAGGGAATTLRDDDGNDLVPVLLGILAVLAAAVVVLLFALRRSRARPPGSGS
jgi:hypothetical protein